MAITETSSKAPASINNVWVGRYLDDGTVAARKFVTGFRPRFVHIVNITDSIEEIWFEGMAAASGQLRILNGTASLITTLGITVAADGFTFGLNTTIHITNKQYSMMAIG